MKKIFMLVTLIVIVGFAIVALWLTTTEPAAQMYESNALFDSNQSAAESVVDPAPSEMIDADSTALTPTSPIAQRLEADTESPILAAPTSQTSPPTITTIDQLLTALLPPVERTRIAAIETETETDGIDGTLAYVEPIATDGSTWRLVYDPADTYNAAGDFTLTDDVLQTIVHEYAHVLMLNHTQVTHANPTAVYIECDFDEVIVDEGCAQTDSYLTQFIEQFWSESDREDAYDAFLAGDEEDFAYTLFTDLPGEFVSEYAATNPVEDAAESFMFFVLQPKPISGVTANQKVIFFGQFPELVALREYMRTKTLSELRDR